MVDFPNGFIKKDTLKKDGEFFGFPVFKRKGLNVPYKIIGDKRAVLIYECGTQVVINFDKGY